jgi:SulP family sulfate permease
MELAHLCQIRNIKLIICGLDHQPLEMAERSEFSAKYPQVCFCSDLYSGIELAAYS